MKETIKTEMGTTVHYKDEKTEWIEDFDHDGNCVHYKGEFYEQWNEYDKRGNCVYIRAYDVFSGIISEEWRTYDSDGNILTRLNNSVKEGK